MFSALHRSGLIGLAGVLIGVTACNGQGIERYQAKGYAAKGEANSNGDDALAKAKSPPDQGTEKTRKPPPETEGPGSPPTQGPGTGGRVTPTPVGGGSGTGGTGSGGGTPSGPGGSATGTGNFSIALDVCTAKKQAWPAVVDGSVSPVCGEALANNWCCTRADVKAQFPSVAGELERFFKNMVDRDRLVLYHCSVSPTGSSGGKPSYTMHFGKINGQVITYQTLSVLDVMPSGAPASASPCPVVKSKDLQVSSSNSGSTVDFVRDVKPIIVAKCGGSACHSTGSTLGVAGDFETDGTALRAANINRLAAMPPAGSGMPAMTAAELDTISRYMKGL